MFLFRGGQMAEKGTYYEPNSGTKVCLKSGGILPGGRKLWYYRLPQAYLLLAACVLAVGLSAAFPYGMGAVLCVALYVTYRILLSLSFVVEKLLRELMPVLLFGYRPNLSFFSGLARRLRRRNKRGRKKE